MQASLRRAYITALPYEIREEIVFWAMVSSPRLAARTFSAISLLSRSWRPHAQRHMFTGICFNGDFTYLEASRRRAACFAQALSNGTVQPNGVRLNPCRALFIVMPYVGYPTDHIRSDVEPLLKLVEPTLWVLEVQGPYSGENPRLRQAFYFPLIQKVWISDWDPFSAMTLFQPLFPWPKDSQFTPPEPALRPVRLILQHGFEPWKAGKLLRLPREVLGTPRTSSFYVSHIGLFSEEQPRGAIGSR